MAQLRGGLLKQSLTADRAPGLGITVARSTNDLSSVRNWVIQGIVPLMAGIPLLLFALAGLYLSAPPLALALLIPLGLELLLLGVLAPGAYGAARVLRRRRGALASRIAETLDAATSARAAGAWGARWAGCRAPPLAWQPPQCTARDSPGRCAPARWPCR